MLCSINFTIQLRRNRRHPNHNRDHKRCLLAALVVEIFVVDDEMERVKPETENQIKLIHFN